MKSCFFVRLSALFVLPLSILAAEPPSIEKIQQLAREFAFTSTPKLNPKTEFVVTKCEIEGLWEKMNLQIFEVAYKIDGQHFNGFVAVLHDGKIKPIAPNLGGRRSISSELIHNGEFYYTYGWGSGIYRSHVARVRVVHGEVEIARSGGFTARTLFLHVDTDGKVHVRSLPFLDIAHPETAAELGVVAEGDSSEIRILDSKGAVLTPDFSLVP